MNTKQWGNPVTIPHGFYLTLNNVFVLALSNHDIKQALEDCKIEYDAYYFKPKDSE